VGAIATPLARPVGAIATPLARPVGAIATKMRYRLSGIDLHPEQNFSQIRSALSEEIRCEQTDVLDVLPLPAGAVAAQTTGVGGQRGPEIL